MFSAKINMERILGVIMKKKGFTLIELMTVVIVLMVLTTVAVMSYKRYMVHARLAAGYSYIQQLRVKQETYYATYSQYVTTNDLDHVYPSAFLNGVVGEQPWNIDCTSTADPEKDAFCALGFNPGRTVTFGLVTKGWNPTTSSGSGPSCINDKTKPWWVIKAVTWGSTRGSDAGHTVDCYLLRATSEYPMNIYEHHCDQCSACASDCN